MLSKNFYDFDIDLKSNKGRIVGTFSLKNEKYKLRIFGTDNSIAREIGVGSVVDVAKKISESLNFKCKKCKKKLSIEKGEYHHGCLSCL